MRVSAEEMIKDVRVAIDMNHGDDALLGEVDTDTLELDSIIRSKLCEAIRMVELEAPPLMLENGHDIVTDGGAEVKFRADGSGKGYIVLPRNFLRLVAFRMSDWARTVTDPISERDDAYALQSSKWRGVCGCPEKPVCAIVTRREGKVLEFYSCDNTSATVEDATYVVRPEIDKDDRIDLPEECYRAAVYRAASLTLASVGDELSATMLEISRSMLKTR